jgi:hypothetical protein
MVHNQHFLHALHKGTAVPQRSAQPRGRLRKATLFEYSSETILEPCGEVPVHLTLVSTVISKQRVLTVGLAFNACTCLTGQAFAHCVGRVAN